MSNGRNLGLLLGTSTVVPASALTEVSNLVDSDYVTQLSPVKITTATQSFDSNQELDLALTADISGVPNVSVFKEVPQIGFTSKGNWDVNSTASNYDLYDEAQTGYFGVDITPSNASGDGTFTLSSGSFTSSDIGKRVLGNGGEAIISASDGSYSIVSNFNNTNTILSGNWNLYGLSGDADGIKLNEVSSPVSDITLATYTGKYFDPLYNSAGLDLSPDGTKLFLTSQSNSALYRYDLTTPYDLTTASNPTTFSTSFMTDESGVRFKPDGTRVWLCDYGADGIYQRNLSTPWDLSTISGTGVVGFNSGSYGQVSTSNSNPFDIAWSSDGSYFYVPLYDNAPYKQIDQYSVSTPWDLTSTKTYLATLNLQTSPNATPESLDFNSSGTLLFVCRYGSSVVYQFALSTPWMLSSASYSNQFIDFDTVSGGATTTSSFGMRLKRSDTRLYMIQINAATTRVLPHEYSVGSSIAVTSQYIPAITNSTGRINTTSWLDINDMSPDETLNDGEVYYAISTDARTTWKVAKNGEGERSIARNNSGTWQYNSEANLTTVYEGYDLDGNISGDFSTFTQVQGPAGIIGFSGTGFSSDGTSMYLWRASDYTVYQFSLSTPWDESTATYANKSFTPASNNNWKVYSIRFNSDGTLVFLGGEGQSRNTLYAYSLSTAWDISSANSAAVASLPTLNVAGVTGEIDNIIISPNGYYVYGINYQTGTLHRWSLTTAWDLSSRTSNSPDQTNSSLITWSTFSWGLDISLDGTKLYVSNGNPVSLGEWTLSTPFSISGLSSTPNTASSIPGSVYTSIIIGNDGLKIYGTSVSTGVTHKDIGNSFQQSTYGTNETWTNSTYNNEHSALQQALSISINRMNSTQLSGLSDANEFVLGNSLDLMIAPYLSSGTSPISDGVTINYDAEAIIRQAILGTDYIVEQPSPGVVKVVSLTGQNLKIRVL